MHNLTQSLYYYEVHLLYASMLWFAAWALTSIRGASATTKYWIWVATSLNFLFPLGAMLDKIWAPHLSWAAPLGIIGDAAGTMSQGFNATLLSTIWLLGALGMLSRLGLRLRAEHRAALTSHSADVDFKSIAAGVPVKFAGSGHGPAVAGVLRTHISLPAGIDRLLTHRELSAVLIHEVTHARRRDNLIRLIHELSLCLLWFHPLVWITGRRLALYRELSCDESVIQSAHGQDLVSALAKLADPEQTFLLQATASSFISHRLARLSAPRIPSSRLAINSALAAVFIAALSTAVFATVAHTACCFVLKDPPKNVACTRTSLP